MRSTVFIFLFCFSLFLNTSVEPSEMARPGLHDFLSLVYQDYDLVVWSQTSWKWLEMKITSLGMLTHPNYRISFGALFFLSPCRKKKRKGRVSSNQNVNFLLVLDRTCMFKIQSKDSDGNPWAHEVKALGIIWAKFSEFFSPANSIHLDDLGRNFAMNPQSVSSSLFVLNKPRSVNFSSLSLSSLSGPRASKSSPSKTPT